MIARAHGYAGRRRSPGYAACRRSFPGLRFAAPQPITDSVAVFRADQVIKHLAIAGFRFLASRAERADDALGLRRHQPDPQALALLGEEKQPLAAIEVAGA